MQSPRRQDGPLCCALLVFVTHMVFPPTVVTVCNTTSHSNTGTSHRHTGYPHSSSPKCVRYQVRVPPVPVRGVLYHVGGSSWRVALGSTRTPYPLVYPLAWPLPVRHKPSVGATNGNVAILRFHRSQPWWRRRLEDDPRRGVGVH